MSDGPARGTNDAVAYGKTARSWRPKLAPSLVVVRLPDRAWPHQRSARRRWQQSSPHRGDRGISRQPTAQGRPGCLGCTCMLVCDFFCAICTRDRGCSGHLVFPAPSSSKRARTFSKPRAHRVARTRSRICCWKIQPVSLFDSSLRAKGSNPECLRGNSLDCFVAIAPRNDVIGYDSAFSRRVASEVC